MRGWVVDGGRFVFLRNDIFRKIEKLNQFDCTISSSLLTTEITNAWNAGYESALQVVAASFHSESRAFPLISNRGAPSSFKGTFHFFKIL
jgi:hypothetical protein